MPRGVVSGGLDGPRYGLSVARVRAALEARVPRERRWRVAVGPDAQITDLTVNDHACLTFGEPEELFDLTAAFVRDGLAGGLKVVWVSEAGAQRAISELTRRGIAVQPALASGQMAAAGSERRLLSGHAFSASQAIGWLNGQMAACRPEGFPGLRVAVDMSWALRPVTGVEQLPDFEESVAAALVDSAAPGSPPRSPSWAQAMSRASAW
jgi:hypothetical protein